jgi:hypothetical protein
LDATRSAFLFRPWTCARWDSVLARALLPSAVMHHLPTWLLIVAVAAVIGQPAPGRAIAAPATCQLAEPFVQFAEVLGPWTVGECKAGVDTDADGTIHQETSQGTFTRFDGAGRPVFREGARLWIDGPGGMGADVRVVVPASEFGEAVEVRRRTATVLERGSLDEPTMPMGWEALGPPTGRSFPGAACQPSNDELVLGRVQTMFGDERGQVRVLQGVSALRDGSGPEMFERIRGWLAACPEWKATFGEQELTYRVSAHPLAALGEESIRYTVEMTGASTLSPSITDTVVVRYGDLMISHAFLLTTRGQVKDGDLVGIAQLAERKLRSALR